MHKLKHWGGDSSQNMHIMRLSRSHEQISVSWQTSKSIGCQSFIPHCQGDLTGSQISNAQREKSKGTTTSFVPNLDTD